jgi:hypothetical protein
MRQLKIRIGFSSLCWIPVLFLALSVIHKQKGSAALVGRDPFIAMGDR